MKICPDCNAKFESRDWICPVCYKCPSIIKNYISFAPHLAEQNEGFHAEDFGILASLEANNFWFCSRNRLIIWMLENYFPDMRKFFEIGCGTGFVLSGIEQHFASVCLFGSEIYSEGLSYANQRLQKANLFQMDACHIPFEDEFDAIGAFDVLEHIQEDKLVLSEMYKALKPGGGLILTVPQHPFLWSKVDEYACHVRRYTADDLINKLQSCGFSILRKTSFVTLLLPLMTLSRLIKTKKSVDSDPAAELKVNKLFNMFFKKVLGIERLIIRFGLNLPIGGSLLVVAKKNM